LKPPRFVPLGDSELDARHIAGLVQAAAHRFGTNWTRDHALQNVLVITDDALPVELEDGHNLVIRGVYPPCKSMFSLPRSTIVAGPEHTGECRYPYTIHARWRLGSKTDKTDMPVPFLAEVICGLAVLSPTTRLPTEHRFLLAQFHEVSTQVYVSVSDSNLPSR
jgi:hypothetical protein